MGKRLSRLIVIAGGLLLCACVSQPDLPVAWQQHRTTISALEHWQLLSKFGYSNGSDSGSAWLDWNQHGDQSEALLSGPFGSGAAQLLSSSQGAILKRSGEADLLASSAEELTHYLFGWQLPIAQMRYWVRGIPAPGLAVEELTTKPNGLLAQLEQGKWALTFIDYKNTPAGPLPGKILASSGNLRIKLVIKEWRLQDAPSSRIRGPEYNSRIREISSRPGQPIPPITQIYRS